MDTNEAIQWTLVGLAIAAALIWLTVKVLKMKKREGEEGGCCGCSLSENCKKKDLKNCNDAKIKENGAQQKINRE